MPTATATETCTECGRAFKGKVGLGVHLSMTHGIKPKSDARRTAEAMSAAISNRAKGVTITFASGATRTLEIDPERVVGLDAEGRILVNDFAGGSVDSTGEKRSDGFLFGLTLCCNASDKGAEHGIVCRGCYGSEETGQYYFASHYPNDYEGAIADPKVVAPVIQTQCADCGRFHDGGCPPPPVAVTLPHTGALVPAAAATLRIKITGRMDTSDGEAFTAEIWDGKRRRGVIEQTGHGGSTDFIHDTPEDMNWFHALADEYAAIDEDHRFIAHESLLNDLYEEVAMFREFNRKRNATFVVSENTTTLLKGGELISPEIYALNKPLDEASREYIRTNYPTARVWIKNKGWEQA